MIADSSDAPVTRDCRAASVFISSGSIDVQLGWLEQGRGKRVEWNETVQEERRCTLSITG